MTSVLVNEGGYSFQKTLGYVYTNDAAPLAPIYRWYDPVHSNHMITFVGEDPSSEGFFYETIHGYAFPRYGDNCEFNHSISVGGVTLRANRAAGGAISELVWNGKQFINNYDYGRQIQIAFNFTNVGEYDNPNEAGSRYGCPGVVNASVAQGSPVHYAYFSGNTLYTKTSPLQWNPDNWGGSNRWPVMWNGTIEKEVTLNYDTSYSAHVIKWTSILDVPSVDVTGEGDWELVTAYLVAEFNGLYAFDAAIDALYDKTSAVSNNSCLDAPNQDLRPDSGGVIIATANGSHALGAFRTKVGDTVNHFALCRFWNSAGGGKYGADTTKWAVMGRTSDFSGVKSGINTGTAYLVVGSLSDVRQTMREMYLDGY